MLRNTHFKIGLLWKKENNVLWYNRDLAVKRLMSLESRFFTNSRVEIYEAQINEYIGQGYAKKRKKRKKF